MDSKYNHQEHEVMIYKTWEKAHAFAAPSPTKARAQGKTPFTIIMPPPNANDPLHVGHAMFISVEDILIRYHRMLGDAALWLPGTDHAGIETQYVFEKKLKKKGKSRFSYDRETLYQMIWDYVQENSDVAVNQMKKLGASADWSRQKFTLDEDCVDLTLATFESMHKEGLIERDLGMVNYCTKCGTGYSELEIKRETQTNPMYFMKYGPFTIATARPETKFRDTALAVHPNDPRYKDVIGKTFDIQGLLGPISMTVIPDDEVDPEFGTGIMKVTPAHDPHDFDLGKKHGLEVLPIIDFEGRMDFSWFIDAADEHTNTTYLERAIKYHRKKVMVARKLMVEDLEADGLLVKIQHNHTNSMALCYKCNTIIEPLPLSQFFVRVSPLVKNALKALNDGETSVHGAGHDKILRHWLSNLRDWNISRQIVWGIRLPIWYDSTLPENATIIVGFLDESGAFVSGLLSELVESHGLTVIRQNLQTLTAPHESTYVVSRTSPGKNFVQETDTFDTWFSSAQWPVNTLKTTQPGDFSYYYPTSVMETGYDILPFWVMRMMLMGIYLTGSSPFKDVYLHGLVRDEHGKKMSKSKGNVINPLDLVEKYGADALRMALVMSTTAGHDSAVGESKVKGMRNFSNKIWNAARYVLIQEKVKSGASETTDYTNAYYEELTKIVKKVTGELDSLKIGLAAESVHNSFWHWYCDECIEASKNETLPYPALRDGLVVFLKLLHPFMPFVTEAVWKELGYDADTLLILADWPQA